MTAVRIAGAGTPESAWLPFLAALDPPRLDPRPAAAGGARWSRVVVAGAHPDDEVLGVGGLLAALAAAGARVDVVVATDGDASHPGSPTTSPAALAARRRGEGAAALAALGLPGPPRPLGLPDGAAAALEEPVLAALLPLLGPGVRLLAPWDGDGHPDHEAVGRAAARAAAATGAELLAFPVWAWHWAAPGDPRVPWATARSVPLTPRERARKAAAVACHASQVAPLSPHPADAAVLPPAVLARFARPVELLLAAGAA